MKNFKQQFISAISDGELGVIDDTGTLVSIDELEQMFSVIRPELSDMMSAMFIEENNQPVTTERFVIPMDKGHYRVHPDIYDLI